MENPEKQIREYLESLINQFILIKSLRKQQTIMGDWSTPDRARILNLAAYLFRIANASFIRTILIELSKFVSVNEQKSLRDWLNKASEYAEAIIPTQYVHDDGGGRREGINPDQYRSIIEAHEASIENFSQIIGKVKIQRDKALAHSDSAYFNNPAEFYEQPPSIMVRLINL